MRSSTNVILTGLAIADMAVMFEYIPFCLHYYIFNKRNEVEFWSYHWAVYILFHSNFSQIFHTTSICLTVHLAVWRYLSVGFPQRMNNWCSINRAQVSVALAYVLSGVICLPFYLSSEVRSIKSFETNTGEEYKKFYVHMYSVTDNEHELWRNGNFWIYSVVIKLLPCFVLTVVSYFLLNTLNEVKRRKGLLMNTNGLGSLLNSDSYRKRKSHSLRRTKQITRMLLAVLFLFLITEFPQGILGLLSCIMGNQFFHNCYTNFSEVMDISALTNCSINFMLYCTMNTQFRTTFIQLFRPPKKSFVVLRQHARMSTMAHQSTFDDDGHSLNTIQTNSNNLTERLNFSTRQDSSNHIISSNPGILKKKISAI